MYRLRDLLTLLLFALFSSCSAYKSVPYLQTTQSVIMSSPNEKSYEARIVPNDMLSIIVSTSDPTVAMPFNLTNTLGNDRADNDNQSSQYIVDSDGYIDFPVVGKLRIIDMTSSEVEDLIRERLKRYLIETPVVNVRMTDFKVSVLGEVVSPGVVIIKSGKASIFEALAMVGDMTIYGQRNDVKLVRESSSGEKMVVTLDLNDVDIVNSEYYYLCQNDIIYVSPNKTQGNSSVVGSSKTLWVSASTAIISITSLILTLVL